MPIRTQGIHEGKSNDESDAAILRRSLSKVPQSAFSYDRGYSSGQGGNELFPSTHA